MGNRENACRQEVPEPSKPNADFFDVLGAVMSHNSTRGNIQDTERTKESEYNQDLVGDSRNEDNQHGEWAERRRDRHGECIENAGPNIREDSKNEIANIIPIFFWRGQNYLIKMCNDIEFLDDPTLSFPVSSWLGFSVHHNPFLIPPVGHDVGANLRRDHDNTMEKIEWTMCTTATRRQSPNRGGDNRGGVVFRGAEGFSVGDDRVPPELTDICGKFGSIDKIRRSDEAWDRISPSELSSEEEATFCAGRTSLDAPIIPPLPEVTRRKALAATEVVLLEQKQEAAIDSYARRLLNNFQAIRSRLDEKWHTDFPSRVEQLAAQSSQRGLRGALQKRHVGISRLRSAMVHKPAEPKSLRKVYTAPVGIKSPRQANHYESKYTRAMPVTRGGIPVSVDGWMEGKIPGISRTRSTTEDSMVVMCKSLEGSSCSHFAESLQPTCLQASALGMSIHVRNRALASRFIAKYRHAKGGHIMILVPSNSKQVKDQAAKIIQASFRALQVRESVLHSRRVRKRAVETLGQMWREYKTRDIQRGAEVLAKCERLRTRMERRKQNRAAHSMAIFFQDVIYRKRRVSDRTWKESTTVVLILLVIYIALELALQSASNCPFVSAL